VRVGVQITSVDDVWERSDLVLKVKEPIAASTPGCATVRFSSPTCTSPPTNR